MVSIVKAAAGVPESVAKNYFFTLQGPGCLDNILSIMKKTLLTITILAILTLFPPAAKPSGTTTGMAPTDMFLLSFGKGAVQAKLYSDYFCGACKALEPNIEYRLADLVKRNIITITFVDVPLHQKSAMYARYFLYILNDKKEIGRALKARSALFEAAQLNITDKDRLEDFLAKKGFKVKPFDAKPVFSILQGYLREDKITATPTCVTLKGDKKEFHQGVANITKTLEDLK